MGLGSGGLEPRGMGRTFGRLFGHSFWTDRQTDGWMDIPPFVLYNIVPFGSAAQKALQADSKPLLAGPEPIPANSELHPAGSAALPLSFEIGNISYGADAQSLQN